MTMTTWNVEIWCRYAPSWNSGTSRTTGGITMSAMHRLSTACLPAKRQRE